MLTMDESIEVVQEVVRKKASQKSRFEVKRGPQALELDKEIQALNVSIEAMKGIKKIRRTFEPYVTVLLPGEREG